MDFDGNQRPRATLRDVARLAGVSIKTASRALNESHLVKESTRVKVNAAAEALHFRPNTMARELRRGARATTLGFVHADLLNPFYSAVAAGAADALMKRGLQLTMLTSGDSPERESRAIADMLERRVLAVLVAPVGNDHSYFEGERQRGIPLIAVDRPLSKLESDVVVFDNRGGVRDGVTALIDAGHTRIAFLDSAVSRYTHEQRLAGYLDALRWRGIRVEERLMRDDVQTVEDARRVTSALLETATPPSAIFAANNRITVGAFTEIRHRHASVGLLGFDDFELADVMGVSVVAHEPRRMGEVAVDLAYDRMRELEGDIRTVVLPTRVLLRESHRS